MASADDLSIFASCSAEFPDTATELGNLLECMSNAQSAATDSLGAGIDSFYLIFAGALVYFMQTGFAMLCVCIVLCIQQQRPTKKQNERKESSVLRAEFEKTLSAQYCSQIITLV